MCGRVLSDAEGLVLRESDLGREELHRWIFFSLVTE